MQHSTQQGYLTILALQRPPALSKHGQSNMKFLTDLLTIEVVVFFIAIAAVAVVVR